MESSVKEEKGLKRKLEFIVPVEEVESCFSKNYKKVQKTAKMPGFRQGKIPLDTLRKAYKGHVQEAVMDDLFRLFYPKGFASPSNSSGRFSHSFSLWIYMKGQDCKFLLELEVHPEGQSGKLYRLKTEKKGYQVSRRRRLQKHLKN